MEYTYQNVKCVMKYMSTNQKLNFIKIKRNDNYVWRAY